MFNKWNPDVTKATGIRDPSEEFVTRPQDEGFDFAFGLKNPLPASIGYFTVYYISQTVTNNFRNKTKTKLAYTTCGDQYFNYKS
jgi:hypothetical protein